MSRDVQNDQLHMLALEVKSRFAAECRAGINIRSIICDEANNRSHRELSSIQWCSTFYIRVSFKNF